jgi:hypothetical protein
MGCRQVGRQAEDEKADNTPHEAQRKQLLDYETHLAIVRKVGCAARLAAKEILN